MSHDSKSLPRRSLLTYLASATGFLGLSSIAEAATKPTPKPEPPPPAPTAAALQIAQLRDDKTLRSSSFDRTGGNHDNISIEPGATATILEAYGPGVITHIWFTINTQDIYHLKTHVLRAYWDGETTPSIEVPIGDFFGLGLGEYFLFQSALLAVAPLKALNAYFTMPFRKSARITITNEGLIHTSLYYHVDYYTTASLPEDIAYFHAQFRQKTPNSGVMDDWRKNGAPNVLAIKNFDGAQNYVFLEATGRGHLIGVTHACLQNQDEWMGEGDDMIFIDGDTTPTIQGTGTEDYYGGAWNFGARIGAVPFSYPLVGAPNIQNTEVNGGRVNLYRWHIDNPIRFQKSLKFTMEHGHANVRSDNWYTVAYWYQTEPHGAFPILPEVTYRIPHMYRVGGPGALEIPSASHPPPPLPIPAPPVISNPSPTTSGAPKP